MKLKQPDQETISSFQKSNLSIPEININWNASHFHLNNIENPHNITSKLKNLVMEQIEIGVQEIFSLVHVIFIVWMSVISLLVLVIMYYLWYVGDPQKLVNVGTDFLMKELEKLTNCNERAVN